MFPSSRPTAVRIKRQLGAVVVVCLAAFGLSAPSALAVATSSAPATCPGQVFSQPFTAFGDSNYYTLVPGGEFNSPSEGWALYNGARIINATRPNGSTAGVLDLPSGALAISPPVCVTAEYPTARVWVRDVKGSEGVATAVAYVGTKLTVTAPQNVGQVHGQQTSWTPSNPINIQPQVGGGAEGTREARFVFLAVGRSSEVQLYDLYVDPHMK